MAVCYLYFDGFTRTNMSLLCLVFKKAFWQNFLFFWHLCHTTFPTRNEYKIRTIFQKCWNRQHFAGSKLCWWFNGWFVAGSVIKQQKCYMLNIYFRNIILISLNAHTNERKFHLIMDVIPSVLFPYSFIIWSYLFDQILQFTLSIWFSSMIAYLSY